MAILAWLSSLRRRASANSPKFGSVQELRQVVIDKIKSKYGRVEAVKIDDSDSAKFTLEIGHIEVSVDVTNLFGYINSYADENE